MSNWYEWKNGKMRRRTLEEVKAMGSTWHMDDEYEGVILECKCGFKEEGMDGVFVPWEKDNVGFFKWTCQCGKDYHGATLLRVYDSDSEVTQI